MKQKAVEERKPKEQDGQRRSGCGRQMVQGMCIAFSMYSRIPMPKIEWTKEAMKYALCFFPLVGVVIGGAAVGFACLAQWRGLGTLARASVGTAVPLVLTGGIHLDGFLDTVDARSSCQSKEKKLEILKDPHTGAFAIIGCGVYLLLYLAVLSELKEAAFPAMGGVFVVSRALSGWSVISFPKAKKDGLVSTFAAKAGQRAARYSLAAWGLLASVFLIWAGGALAGGMALAAALVTFGYYHRMAMKEFGGVTGDLAGYFLQICELGMLAALAVFFNS